MSHTAWFQTPRPQRLIDVSLIFSPTLGQPSGVHGSSCLQPILASSSVGRGPLFGEREDNLVASYEDSSSVFSSASPSYSPVRVL